MQDVYVPVSNPNIPASGSSPPPSFTAEDTGMGDTKTDTKDKYQTKTSKTNKIQDSPKNNERTQLKTRSATKLEQRKSTSMDTSSDDIKNSLEESSLNETQNNCNSVPENLNDTTSDRGSPELNDTGDLKYSCPICEIELQTQHDVTLHLRSHNNAVDNPNQQQSQSSDNKPFVCRICSKVLSSNSSLDRHILVHSGERPFRCKYCSVTFTTNGNMHRHMRTHCQTNVNYESDGSTDSNGSVQSSNCNAKATRKRRYEYNNNKVSTLESPDVNRKKYNETEEESCKKRKIDSSEISEDDNGIQPTNKRKIKNVNNNYELVPQKLQCPVCDRKDFVSLNYFEKHIEETHPEYEIKCHSCNLGFKNYRVFHLHRFMVHQDERHVNNIKNVKNSIVGFKDLNFVDFTSEKFPIIAKSFCEKSFRRADNNDLKFECEKCGRAFPCQSALEIHQNDCLNFQNAYYKEEDLPTDYSSKLEKFNQLDENMKREDFFAILDLQNKSIKSEQKIQSVTSTIPEIANELPKLKLKEYLSMKKPETLTGTSRPVDTTKDLADIQSILSVTSTGSLLQQLTAPKNIQEEPHISHSDAMIKQSAANEATEEELQDAFAAEFRKMKLRGEFPCRLCTAVFPNLRALKGHNRAHLSGSGNTGPYRCNMCPHSSVDKAALIRHLRGHNGDRPYECSLCNYAFTTKANCERHLRNRHAKVTREEVKKAIIYHPSEDPTNDEMTTKFYQSSIKLEDMSSSKSYGSREDIKRSLFPTSSLHRDKQMDIHKLSNSSQSSFTSNDDLNTQSIPVAVIPKSITSLAVPLQNAQQLNDTISAFNIPFVNDNTMAKTFSLPFTKDNLTALKEHRIAPKTALIGNSGILNLSAENSHQDRIMNCSPIIVDDEPKSFQPLKQIPEYESSENEHSDSETEEKTTLNITDTPLSRHSQFRIVNQRKMLNTPTEHPIDLSMDVLDLSKKRSPTPQNIEEDDEEEEEEENCSVQNNDEAQDFTKKALDYSTPPSSQNLSNALRNHLPTEAIFEKTQLLLAQQLLKSSATPITPTANSFYANQLHQFYRHSPFPNVPAFPLNPYFLQPHPFLTPTASPQDLQEMKERIQKEIIRGLQLSGGSLVMDHMSLASERLQAFHQQALSNLKPDIKPEFKYNTSIKTEDMKTPIIPLQVETNQFSDMNSMKLKSPKNQIKTSTEIITPVTPNSVKMVIKNGVLMPKQKQRRYRTERPFACEHCSARFTLRSNMERHIKQQHPQFWSQRQRSNMSGVPGRKSTLPTMTPPNNQTLKQNYFDQNAVLQNNIQNNDYALPKNSPNLILPNTNTKNELITNMTYNLNKPMSITDQIRYSILTQQLKQQSNELKISVDNEPMETSTTVEKNYPKTIDDSDNENDETEDALIIDEGSQSQSNDVQKESVRIAQFNSGENRDESRKSLEDKLLELRKIREKILLVEQKGTVDLSQGQENIDNEKGIEKLDKLNNTTNSLEEIKTVSVTVSDISNVQQNSVAKITKSEDGGQDLVPVSRLLDNAASAQLPFREYFRREGEDHETPSEEDEDGFIASGSTSEGNASGSDGNRSESEAANSLNNTTSTNGKKKSAYSLAPNRVTCPYCSRKFPWSSSLRRHILTHTGQKPFKCSHCPLLFTTKSNCDRHLLRKHGNVANASTIVTDPNPIIPNTIEPTASVLPRSQNFMMRNVPERPFKCSTCPSSTFSTLSNLKKHMSCKHNIQDSRPDTPKTDFENQQNSVNSRPPSQYSGGNYSGYESHSSEDERGAQNIDSEMLKETSDVQRFINYQKNSDWEQQINAQQIKPGEHHSSNMQNTLDLPFKCHLCDASYGERQDALDHIKSNHGDEYELLLSKGALEINANSYQHHIEHNSDNANHNNDNLSGEDDVQIRGKFPDYANRKVMCAFCMRRFWSAEDLRRHMRTHSGVRPFSCDICRRKFTLKHSMLRHRKKHNVSESQQSNSDPNISANEDISPCEDNISPLSGDEDCPPSKADDILMAKNDNDIKISAINLTHKHASEDESEGMEGTDLIGNLLGIRDKSIIDQVLISSADDAAKLLGVNRNNQD